MSDGDTGSMWANMLGLGPLMQTIQDPKFLGQIQQFVALIADTQARTVRIEAKLDTLLRQLSTDYAVGEPDEPTAGATFVAAIGIAAIPADRPSTGMGGHPATGFAVDHGSSAPGAPGGRPRNGAG